MFNIKFINYSLIILILIIFVFPSCKKSDDLSNFRWVASTDGLRLRKAPDSNSEVISVLPFGSKVEYISEKNETIEISKHKGKWTEIKWENKTGWLFGGFLTTENKYRIVTTINGLPIRYYHTAQGKLIPLNSIVELSPKTISNNTDFVNILWQGKEGKVHSSFLQQIGININPDSDSNEIKKLFIESRKNVISATDNNYKLHPEDISINKLGDFYLITYIFYNGEDMEHSYFYDLWHKTNNTYKEYNFSKNDPRFHRTGRPSDYIELLYVNNDSYPDVILHGGCCDHGYVSLYLGKSNNELFKNGSYEGDVEKAAFLSSLGKCDKTIVSMENKKYYFDCNSNKFITK